MSAAKRSEGELEEQVERSGSTDRRVLREVHKTLIRAGEAGIQAVLRGLAHPDARVRQCCAEFMDDHGTEACVEPLLQVAQHDPEMLVRAAAAHSLGCQRCKTTPVEADLVEPLIEIAFLDESLRVRREAVGRLGEQRPDARAAAALWTILGRDARRKSLLGVQRALSHHGEASPVQEEFVDLLIQQLLTDERQRVRRDAAVCLSKQPPDRRIAAALRTFLSRETHPKSRKVGHQALMRRDEAYRQTHIAAWRARCQVRSNPAASNGKGNISG